MAVGANARELVRLYSRAIGGDAFAVAFFGLEFVLAAALARPGDPLDTALGGGVVCGGTACYSPSSPSVAEFAARRSPALPLPPPPPPLPWACPGSASTSYPRAL